MEVTFFSEATGRSSHLGFIMPKNSSTYLFLFSFCTCAYRETKMRQSNLHVTRYEFFFFPLFRALTCSNIVLCNFFLILFFRRPELFSILKNNQHDLTANKFNVWIYFYDVNESYTPSSINIIQISCVSNRHRQYHLKYVYQLSMITKIKKTTWNDLILYHSLEFWINFFSILFPCWVTTAGILLPSITELSRSCSISFWILFFPIYNLCIVSKF